MSTAAGAIPNVWLSVVVARPSCHWLNGRAVHVAGRERRPGEPKAFVAHVLAGQVSHAVGGLDGDLVNVRIQPRNAGEGVEGAIRRGLCTEAVHLTGGERSVPDRHLVHEALQGLQPSLRTAAALPNAKAARLPSRCRRRRNGDGERGAAVHEEGGAGLVIVQDGRHVVPHLVAVGAARVLHRQASVGGPVHQTKLARLSVPHGGQCAVEAG
eukprot:scaffold2729_cov403-Prasinococcus_capsulatus_cf.AAC.7